MEAHTSDISESKITEDQMQFLKDQSKSVKQVIRLYLEGVTLQDIDLRLLSASDVLFGRAPSVGTPMYYSMDYVGVYKKDGRRGAVSELQVVGNARRLPIVDALLQPMSQQVGNFYVSMRLQELCFA